MLLYAFAFLAGLATVFSPCVLPVLPAILSAGVGRGRLRPLGIILGLIISFCFFTLALTYLVKSFGISADFLRYAAIVIIGVFGLVMLFPYLSDRFATWTAPVADLGASIQTYERERKQSSGFISGFLLGIALGLVWTPCAGPILGAIVANVATQSLTSKIVLLILSYSIGAGIPLFLIAYGGNRALSQIPSLAKHSEVIRQFFGGLMILVAIALAFNLDSAFQQKVLDYLPSIQVENNAYVQKELQHLRSQPADFPPNDFSPDVSKSDESKAVVNLPKISKAPNFEGITKWINSDPLTIEKLKGKVVLVDFWTYSCINCIRTFPYLKTWYENYKDKGFVIVGVHTPEFEFEKNPSNVEKAVKRFNITYPVAMDNNYKTWEAYHNSYWPAHYLIDQDGFIREVHYGEGAYVETENAIRSLLNEKPLATVEEKKISSSPMTSETYLGYSRGKSYTHQEQITRDHSAYYNYTMPLLPDEVGIKGPWKVEGESMTSESDHSTLTLNFLSNRVYLVLGGQSDVPIRVELDGSPLSKENYSQDMNWKGEIFVKDDRKYDIVDLKGNVGRHTVTLHIPKGIKAYAFSFGMESD